MLQPPTIGRIIRFHREAAGLSRQALSELAGVGTTALYDVEHGKETVQLRTLLRLLEALNIDLRLDGPLMEQFAATEQPEATGQLTATDLSTPTRPSDAHR
jgi:HTH-type transcriptional regulator / antitoxin HipB